MSRPVSVDRFATAASGEPRANWQSASWQMRRNEILMARLKYLLKEAPWAGLDRSKIRF
jgi:hypothetical protein